MFLRSRHGNVDASGGDSGWAGEMSKELKGRSANCVGMIGKRAIETVSRTQKTNALSSAKAELYREQPGSCRHSANQTLHGRGRVCSTSTCMERQFQRMRQSAERVVASERCRHSMALYRIRYTNRRCLLKAQVRSGTALETWVQYLILQIFLECRITLLSLRRIP